MNSMTIYVSRSRDMLLGIKLHDHLEHLLQRPLSKLPNANSEYSMVVYCRTHGNNFPELAIVRLTNGTTPKMVRMSHNVNSRIFAETLLNSVGPEEPITFQQLDLSKIAITRLKNAGIHDVQGILARTEKEIKRIPGIGKMVFKEIEEELKHFGLRLNPY